MDGDELVHEAIRIVYGRVPYPIIASDMERAGYVLAAKVETLWSELAAERLARGEAVAKGQTAEAELLTAQAAIERVLAIHVMRDDDLCRECLDDWPCNTIRAINGDPT